MDRSIEWITVSTGVPGKHRTLTTVAALGEFLLEKCPQAIPAHKACLDALEGRIEPDEARAVFAEAVVEEGFYIMPHGRTPRA